MIIRYTDSKPAFSPSLLLILGSCVCSLIQLVSLPYGRTSLISFSNRVLLLLWILVIGFVLFQRFLKPIPGKMTNIVLVIALSMVSWLIAAIDKPGMAVDNFMRTIGFLTFPFMLCYSAFYKIDERAKTVICIFAILCSFVFIQLYHSDKCYVYNGYYGLVYLEEVTLGYANPNQTGMYLFLCATTLFTAVFYFKSLFLKLLIAADGCYIVWIMLQTQSRTATLLIAIFVVLAIFLRKKELPRLMIGLTLIIPLLYLLLLAILPDTTGDILFMDESIFNGREQIYDRYLQNLNVESFLLGNMSRFRFDNLHNGYIAIAASVGVIACLCYVLCIRENLAGNYPDSKAPTYVRVSFLAFLCAIMYTGSEAAFFVGGSHYAFLLFCPVVLFAKPFAGEAVKDGGV